MKALTLLIKPAAGLCNMNCKYCFYKTASETRENRIMTGATVDMLIRKIKYFRPSALSIIFQGGEPTLAGLDYYQDFVKKVKENIFVPVSYALQTNGLLIDNGYAKFFKENDFLVGISLDGNRKTTDRYRCDKNGDSVFPQILNSISILKKNQVDFNILSVIDSENAKDIESTYAYFKKHNFNFLQFVPYVNECEKISLSSTDYERFLKKIFDLWYDDFINGKYISVRHIDNYINILLGASPESCAMCGICGNYFVVEAGGDLFPCDFYCKKEYQLGTVFDENPFEKSEKQQDFIRKSFIIHNSCKTCKYYALCRGGCRRDRCDDLTKNIYCTAYKNFFDYSIDRMKFVSEAIKNNRVAF